MSEVKKSIAIWPTLAVCSSLGSAGCEVYSVFLQFCSSDASMPKQKLSVVIPNFNHAQYVQEALESVLTQSRVPDSVLVVDDCSTDNSVAVISRYLSNPILTLKRNPQNLGVTRNLRAALEQVDSEYVVILAADDRVLPGFFEKCVNMLEQHPQAGLCCSRPAFMDKDGNLDLRLDWYTYPKEACYVDPVSCVSE